MSQDTLNTLSKSAKHFFSGTLVSRILGLIREVLMAAAFGTTPAVAAFWMAFRFAHLLRRLFGEGGLNVAFIPHFEVLRKIDENKAARFFYDLSFGLTSLLLGITFIVEVILCAVLCFSTLSIESREVIRLTAIMMPALLFICLYALNSSLLQCEKKYFLPSVAPSFLNLVWIIAVIALQKKTPSSAIQSLAMIIVFAFALQWLVTVPMTYNYLKDKISQVETKGIWKEIRKIISPFLLAICGVAATQINSALDALFARSADPEGPAILWYAIRLQQLPLALLGVGLTGALLPPISRAVGDNDQKKYAQFLNFSLRKLLTLMIPITFGCFCLGFSSINLVYGRGEFNTHSTIQSTYCLWGYALGLVPMNMVLILAAAFYSTKNYKIPTIFCLITVCLNIAFNAFFVYILEMKAVSIALSTSFVAFINALLLGITLYRKNPDAFKGLLKVFFSVLLCTFIATWITCVAGHYLFEDNTWAFLFRMPYASFSRKLLTQLQVFISLASIFGITLLFFAWLFRVEEILKLIPKLNMRRLFNPK